jgi:ferric-dicitrate binding protein FerR (iron transport regulator)
MEEEEIDVQLLDYITGHLSAEGQARAREWIEKDEACREYYEQFHVGYLRQRWYFREQLIRGNRERARGYAGKRRRVARYALLVAASVVLFLGSLVYRAGVTGRGEGVGEAIVPGTLKAKLMVDPGRVISLGDDVAGIIEIDGGGKVLMKARGSIDYRGNEARSSRVQQHVLMVGKGGEYSITLEDGSVVQLNSASTLSYPVAFTGDERRVRLSGEAYFRVSPGDAPFVVEVGDIRVRVTGTEFNVNTHKKNQVETVLVAGSVDVIKDTCRYPLALSQKATYVIDSGEVIVETVEVDKYIAWKNGDIVFVDERLEDIMYKLSLWYDFEVYYAQPGVKDILLSGDMMKYDRIENLLYFFENSSGAVFEITGKRIVVSMQEKSK